MLIRTAAFMFALGAGILLTGCAATRTVSEPVPPPRQVQQPSSPLGANEPKADSESAPVSFAVVGRPWRLRNLPFAVADRSASQREAFVTFKSGGAVMEGNTGCNPIRATYEIQGPVLRIRNLEGTLMPCPDGVTFEALFIQALSDTAEWREDGGALVLLNADGYQLAIFDSAAP